MKELSNHQLAVELLQQFGLKEYEARCFVALSRVSKATAKEISDESEVPRTRVYDAVRVLESKGLVEVQHSSPQQFRSVPIHEATETLRREYESRTNRLVETLENLEPVLPADDREVTHEVWSLSGTTAIANRTAQLIDTAQREVVFIIGRDAVVTDELLENLQKACKRGLDVIVGTVSSSLRSRIREAVPDAEVFVSELEWLHTTSLDSTDDTSISRLLLIDQSAILVSSIHENSPDGERTEKAVFGRGFDNGIVVIARRLMATGLEPVDDPRLSDS